jgi:phospholipid/cholesterol/gamma-HCH transport system substrate-binding protein
LGKTVKNLNKTLAKVDGIMKVGSGNGTMGKLLNDALYIQLVQNFKELELLQDVRLHPTRYVNVSFGKKEKPYPVADTISKKKTSDYELFR